MTCQVWIGADMPMTSPPAVPRPARGHAGLVVALIALVLLVLLVLTPATARALTVAVTWPDTVTVGQTGLTAQLTLTNTEAGVTTVCNAGQCEPPSEGIIVIPSCGAASVPPACDSPDPGVFTFAPTATSPPGTTCSFSPITGFTVTVVDAARGKLRVEPQGGPITLLSDLFTSCDIVLSFSVAHLPLIDGAPAVAGLQTHASVSAQTSAGNQPVGTARHVTTVLPPAVSPPGPPPPSPQPPPPPPPTAPVDLDHFKCYDALQAGFRQRTVGLRDQFGQRRARVVRTRELCNPVSKNEGRVLQPLAHLVCYETRDQNTRFVRRQVLVNNQFGRRKLTVTRPSRLCVPSLKRRTGGAPPSTPDPARLVDHFRCYDVTAQPAARTVTLRDQFRTSRTAVLRVVRLCNPVRKNNEPMRRARSHLVCYSIRDAQAFNPLAVRVRNQFGRAALRVRRPVTLCLPSFKEVIATEAAAAAPAGLDHFKCYEAEQPNFQPRTVGLRDQFGQAAAKVVATRQLCNPVSKNGGRILNRQAHLVCYETADAGIVPFPLRDVRVSNQFGIRALTVVRPATLCVPSLKRRGAGAAPTGPDPTRVLDHFRCYDVKPQPVARTVKLADQFKTSKTKVLRVVRLCNPVRKNEEPVRRPSAHLVCYSITEAAFPPLVVTVRNQFGVGALRVRRPQMLCLPSFKRLVAADGSALDNPA
jgi:hypothetical protein